ncbi:MAG: N-acetyltransferase [Dehalococcoidales bacterium]|nr:N-acetyltransferase [Dehalococcoidales bacterium]
MLIIRRETPEDIDSIRYINSQAFGQKEEAELVDKLRNRDVITLSLVAVQADQIVGHIVFSPVTVESEYSSFEAIALAPMAVLPAYQRKGIGSQLVRVGLEECRRLGHEIVVVLGHPDYYPRFGFAPGKPEGIDCEFEAPDEAWMVLELRKGALAGRSGTVRFQPEFREAM